MELKKDFLDHQSDDIRNNGNNDVGADNDSLGENSEQTPLAKALQEDRDRDAEDKGWNNNKPGATNAADDDDQRIHSVTPHNDNGLPGPEDDDFDDDDDDDDELIPIETEDDDDFLGDDEDDDDDVDDIIDEKKEKPADSSGSHHHHIDISHVTPSEDRPFGRTSGRMIDHEPGTTNNPD